ncbi:MAG TPA: 50S ribosomal protein L19 [Candidatus Paceibacterota bacterium]|nr:50S ribosomal protein L19 [Candidatus Paceibacterota bacterium]
MNTELISKITTTPVNMESRKKLELTAGDTVRVWVKVLEDKAKQKYRLQAFEGLVLSTKHGNTAGASFTVRRVASGVGVERVFPLFSPSINEIELVKRSTVRRAKLYYVREKAVRDVRRKMKQTIIGGGSSTDFETAE